MKKKKAANKGKGGLIAVVSIISFLFVIAFIAVILALARRGGKPAEQEAQGGTGSGRRNVVVTRDNVDSVVENLMNQEYVEPGYYTVSMDSEWHFATGDSVSEDAYVANLAENTNDVFFDVFLSGDEENAIYQSPVIPLGASLDGIKLDTPLGAGNYDCVMIYHLVDDDQNTVDTLRVKLRVIVEG